jgi:PKHD-type hydroxylase
MDYSASNVNVTINAILSYKNIFTPEECRKIINCPDLGEAQDADLFKANPEYIIKNIMVKHFRKTENTLWIEKKLAELAVETNNISFNFSIGSLEELQILECEKDAFIDWHIEIGRGKAASRKINLITFLSERQDYEGGVISSSLLKPAIEILPQEQGSTLLFPAFRPYMLEPVTGGKLYMMMAWMHGDSFQ